jgi:hypothetical protein
LALLALVPPASAQVDPEKRRLIQMGIDQSLSGPSPEGAYLFYYINQPHFVRDDLTLRLAVAPVYIDSELAMSSSPAHGGNILAVGLAGGGFADDYAEVRGGQYFRGESFDGNSATISASLYRCLNPTQVMPLNLIARLSAHSAVYWRTSQTQADFTLPPDHRDYKLRLGLRLGGIPPELIPSRAGELSLWYEPTSRDHSRTYGLNGDRTLELFTEVFWTRAAVAYRLKNGARFEASAIAGGTKNADRFDAFRIGGMLPFSSEFPLGLPGYFNGELTVQRFALFGGRYSRPMVPNSSFHWEAFAYSADVTFLQGLDQPRPWNSGVGGGLAFQSKARVWQAKLDYGYGIDAIRSGGRGAHSVALMLQLDLEAWRKKGIPESRPYLEPNNPQSLDWARNLLKW